MHKDKIAFQGIVGGFGHEAVEKYFGKDHETIGCKTFEDVAISVSEGKVRYGLLPIESSVTGSIIECYDYFLKYNLNIVGEVSIPVVHCLYAKDPQQITKIYSHVQVLRQCAKYLSENYPNAEQIELVSTIAALQKLKEDGDDLGIAAIASKRGGELYNLNSIVEGIQNSKVAATRFFIVALEEEKVENANKLSICFSIDSTKSSFSDFIKNFSSGKITHIESRPIPQKQWEYLYFLDIETESLDHIIDLAQYCTMFKVLGYYQSHYN